jgi:hypothetical protein
MPRILQPDSLEEAEEALSELVVETPPQVVTSEEGTTQESTQAVDTVTQQGGPAAPRTEEG